MTALTVIDRDGLDALSMRAVAAELDIGTMSLYRYIIDRRPWNPKKANPPPSGRNVLT
jgi:hypothetical protein